MSQRLELSEALESGPCTLRSSVPRSFGDLAICKSIQASSIPIYKESSLGSLPHEWGEEKGVAVESGGICVLKLWMRCPETERCHLENAEGHPKKQLFPAAAILIIESRSRNICFCFLVALPISASLRP